ncbi:MAG: hypothetical protein NZ765_13050 [Anaerolineae bacterium]|nr:hypothetical protein [Anaerolineae bacterium]MDW8072506.1 hypothetical protein [Anaerolineae bacterium]
MGASRSPQLSAIHGMIYLAELYYLQDQQHFPYQKAVSVTATAVARWCTHFYARVIVPTSKSANLVMEKCGCLPADPEQRGTFVADCVRWLWQSSVIPDLFCLLLDDRPVPCKDRVAKFDHHDDPCCWVLNLSEHEFAVLQHIWKANDLPEDLFYPEGKQVCIPWPGTNRKARLLRALGAQKCYTPRQWEVEQRSDLGR